MFPLPRYRLPSSCYWSFLDSLISPSPIVPSLGWYWLVFNSNAPTLLSVQLSRVCSKLSSISSSIIGHTCFCSSSIAPVAPLSSYYFSLLAAYCLGFFSIFCAPSSLSPMSKSTMSGSLQIFSESIIFAIDARYLSNSFVLPTTEVRCLKSVSPWII